MHISFTFAPLLAPITKTHIQFNLLYTQLTDYSTLFSMFYYNVNE